MFSKMRILPLIMTGFLLACLAITWAQTPRTGPKVIKLDTEGQAYVQLLGGPPDNLVLRSGAVMLQPGKTVGKHNTESYEELIIVLEGHGTMVLSDGKHLELQIGTALYCPPDTEHDVKNVGVTPLKYVYVVAKTR